MSRDAEGEPREFPRWLRLAVPVLIGLVFLALWELSVRALEVPKFVLPAPSMILAALIEERATLLASLWVTLGLTLAAFAAALVLGFAFAVLFAHSRLIEMSLFPYAVILQVTPIVSIAPLVLIWVGLDHLEWALLILATIVAFFPEERRP
jgi:NitT/TauT family transport system permease protein